MPEPNETNKRVAHCTRCRKELEPGQGIRVDDPYWTNNTVYYCPECKEITDFRTDYLNLDFEWKWTPRPNRDAEQKPSRRFIELDQAKAAQLGRPLSIPERRQILEEVRREYGFDKEGGEASALVNPS